MLRVFHDVGVDIVDAIQGFAAHLGELTIVTAEID
jgi:hypothetical protein